jgi:UDP-glucose 4-epimerase
VVIYDNLSTGHRALVGDFEFVLGDLREREKLRSVLGCVEGVMHFAASSDVGESVSSPRKYFENNVVGAISLLDSVLDAGIRQFVFSSSCSVYGLPIKVPITEDAVRSPVSPYGVSKALFEQALEAYSAAYGLRYVSLRYFNAAGADDSGSIGELHEPEPHLIPSALHVAADSRRQLEIFGKDYPTADGTCIRDYVHVNDLAFGHASALEYLNDGGKSVAINLGTGTGSAVLQVIETVEAVVGFPLNKRFRRWRPGDPPVLVADPARAKGLLGWTPKRTVPDMVSSAWNWLQRSTHLTSRKERRS